MPASLSQLSWSCSNAVAKTLPIIWNRQLFFKYPIISNYNLIKWKGKWITSIISIDTFIRLIPFSIVIDFYNNVCLSSFCTYKNNKQASTLMNMFVSLFVWLSLMRSYNIHLNAMKLGWVVNAKTLVKLFYNRCELFYMRVPIHWSNEPISLGHSFLFLCSIAFHKQREYEWEAKVYDGSIKKSKK